jgi:putative transposase
MKKHSPEEVLGKLGHANELAQRGLSQIEICNELGVSIMTLHRWKKLPMRHFGAHSARETLSPTHVPKPASGNDLQHLQELQLENQQLRKIITDLMLEKLRIEEAIAKSQLTEQKSN